MIGHGSLRRYAATVALVSLGLLCSAPASAATDGPDLILTHGGSNPPAVLAPGSTSRWSIGVTARAVTLHDLRMRLLADGPLMELAASDESARVVTVGVRSCTTAWAAAVCRSGENTVIPTTTLSSLGGATSLANPDGGIPAGVELLLEVTLSPSAGNSVQGLSTRITARVDAAGEPAGPHDFPGTALADTGFRLGIFALLGLGTVLAGALASKLAGARAAADGIAPARDPGGD
jgi:hypothetical protein